MESRGHDDFQKNDGTPVLGPFLKYVKKCKIRVKRRAARFFLKSNRQNTGTGKRF